MPLASTDLYQLTAAPVTIDGKLLSDQSASFLRNWVMLYVRHYRCDSCPDKSCAEHPSNRGSRNAGDPSPREPEDPRPQGGPLCGMTAYDQRFWIC